MAQRKKWEPERMKAAVEVIRNRKWTASERPVFSTYPIKQYRVMLKTGRKAQVKQ